MNFASGWCAIVALGDYDHHQGGHLVVEELGFVIEFPPASTILMPSAFLHHANTLLPNGQHRAALTFYNPGGLFHFVDNGFKTEKQLWIEDPNHFERMQMKKRTGHERYKYLYSKLGELDIHAQ